MTLWTLRSRANARASTLHLTLVAAVLLGAGAVGCGETDEPIDDDETGRDEDKGEDDETDDNDDELETSDAAASDGDGPGGSSTSDAGGRGNSRDAGADKLDASRPGTTLSDSSAARPDSGVRSDAGSALSDAGPASAPGASVVPAGDHCAMVAGFDAKWTAFEDEVLTLTNEARAKGFNCDSKGMFGPTTPLKMDARLRCSSRLHSKYMAETGDFAHTQMATGSDPFARMKAAGYTFSTAGENIAYGQPTPKSVVDGWLESDGHCANIMSPNFVDLGVGYFIGMPRTGSRAQPYWTQNFGRMGR